MAYSPSGFLALLDCEVALLEAEPVHLFLHQQREHFLLVSHAALLGLWERDGWVLAAINEQILLA